jgi:crotonobetainyl-CoA:carnitine CoA-transferase CaiB-like acyl-CoA transferase
MTKLERALANIFVAIEEARAARDALALAALLQRKEAICAALNAPEQCWHYPSAQERGSAKDVSSHEAAMPLVA